jgi:hypothetical protein
LDTKYDAVAGWRRSLKRQLSNGVIPSRDLASSTEDAKPRSEKSSPMISTLKFYRETDDRCLRNPRTRTLLDGEQTAGQLGDEERVENILRKSRNDHVRDPQHSLGLPARDRCSTLDGGCEQTASGWDGPRYGSSWASQPVRSSTTTKQTRPDF